MYMHGKIKKGGEDRLPQKIIPRATGFGQHMQSVPSPRISVEGKSSSLIVSTTADAASSFSKDGRKISVGDCALFKPPHDSPPFIGVICSLGYSEDKNLQLGVTWLYRPGEVKLGKNFFLDAAPNEIFYSFHKDGKIPAASLLHPCKVAFLPKGVELPKGISSFVCRRVYDIDNKCLWWLTDKDYIDERQEEVNKLLNRTQKEMESIVQAGGYSPTVTSAASHLKSASDNVASVPSQIKVKKRDRNDQSCEPSKTDDDDSGSLRSVNRLKPEVAKITENGGLRSEISKITENGGLVDSKSVEKLVELIGPRDDRKLDLGIRSMVSSVIAATDRCDCLGQFVQLKGLSVLDEWLQDVNKGRLKDSDKAVEEFLFVLLRALDKLPVNLHALQTCNIGRSVNGLRTYKNLEIQKKSRSLVDRWKKQVESEMNVIESAKNGSARTSREVSMKSSVLQPSESKAVSIKRAYPGEATTTNSACSSPGPVKSSSLTPSEKEIKNRNASNNGTGVPLSCRGEDQNCNSAPTHQVSMNVNKIQSVGLRRHKSVNGFTEIPEPLSLKERVSNRSSLLGHENASHEKLPQSPLTCEKLIVKIPKRFRSGAALSPTDGSGDASVINGLASPVLSSEQDSKNVVSCVKNNDRKDSQVGFEVGDSCSTALHESRKSSEGSRSPTSSLEKKDLKVKKPPEASSSAAMDALIESCVKYSEESASTSPRVGDDVGMNLLASVATREVLSCESGPLACSRVQNVSSIEEENSLGDGCMSKTCLQGNGETVIAASLCVLSREQETHQSIEYSGDRTACSNSSQGIKVIADCSSADGNDSSVSKGVTVEEYGKKVENSTRSPSGEIDPEKGIDKNAKVEMKPGLIRDDDALDENLKNSNLSVDETQSEKKDSSAVDKTQSAPEVETKLDFDFDLNESLVGDDEKYDDEQPDSGISGASVILLGSNPLSMPPLSVGPAAAEGTFVPPVDDVLKNKGSLRSAATSAFRPAEPKKTGLMSQNCAPTRPLDIDLNVADETGQDCAVVDLLPSTSGQLHNSKNDVNRYTPCTDLDLNRVDDSSFMMPFRPLFPSSLPVKDVKRDFDLNNGPGFDDGVTEPPPPPPSSLNHLFMNSNLPFSGLRPNGLVPHLNPYSSVINRRDPLIPLITTPINTPQQRIIMSDMYHRSGAVLPFGATVPLLPPGAFSAGSSSVMNPLFRNPNNTFGLQHPNPFATGLDLNTGPGIIDLESRDDFMTTQRRQLLGSGSNTRGGEDHGQGRMYSITGGGAIKRKEPDGGLDRENLRYKQQQQQQPSSWH